MLADEVRLRQSLDIVCRSARLLDDLRDPAGMLLSVLSRHVRWPATSGLEQDVLPPAQDAAPLVLGAAALESSQRDRKVAVGVPDALNPGVGVIAEDVDPFDDHRDR